MQQLKSRRVFDCVVFAHLDLRVGLAGADDPLPLPIATSSRPPAAGPQRERGSLPEHTAAMRSLSAQPVICSLTTGGC